MDNKQSLEDKPTTNAAAEEILSDEELDSVAGGTGSGDSIWNTDANNIHVFGYGGGTGIGDSIWNRIRDGGTGRG